MKSHEEEREHISRELKALSEEIERLRELIAGRSATSPVSDDVARRFEQVCLRRQELSGSAAHLEWEEGETLTRLKRELENIWDEIKYAAAQGSRGKD